MLVDNKPGAYDAVAFAAVASLPADDHTLFLADDGQLSIGPHLQKRLAFDPARKLVPVTQLANQPFLIWVNKGLGARSMGEVFALARAKPGTVNYGTVDVGSPHHLCMAATANAAHVKLTHIPYKSAANQLVPAMMSNEVSLTCTSPVVAGPMVASGKVEALVVAPSRRAKSHPALRPLARQRACQTWTSQPPSASLSGPAHHS